MSKEQILRENSWISPSGIGKYCEEAESIFIKKVDKNLLYRYATPWDTQEYHIKLKNQFECYHLHTHKSIGEFIINNHFMRKNIEYIIDIREKNITIYKMSEQSLELFMKEFIQEQNSIIKHAKDMIVKVCEFVRGR